MAQGNWGHHWLVLLTQYKPFSLAVKMLVLSCPYHIKECLGSIPGSGFWFQLPSRMTLGEVVQVVGFLTPVWKTCPELQASALDGPSPSCCGQLVRGESADVSSVSLCPSKLRQGCAWRRGILAGFAQMASHPSFLPRPVASSKGWWKGWKNWVVRGAWARDSRLRQQGKVSSLRAYAFRTTGWQYEYDTSKGFFYLILTYILWQ